MQPAARPLKGIVRPGHPLARLGRRVTLADLKKHRLGLLPGGYGVRQVLLSAEHGDRMRLVPQLLTNSARALLHFVEQWNGVIITAAFAAAREVEEGRVLALEAEPPLLEGGEAHLVTRRGRRLSPAAQQLLRHLRSKVTIVRRF